ncbi:MAG: OmpA family protein [Chromatiaceae bacterium]|jgi:OOP family OmpA-OmpF porin|nr:OmpA family protein [Chromatiaceae bacterium]
MKLNKIMVAALFATQLGFSAGALADETVPNYVEAPSGTVVKSGSGECVRTRFDDTTKKLEECGYPAEPTMEVEVVAAPTAATITATVSEQITIAASMLFAFDSADLSDDAKAVIDERIHALKGGAKLTSVMKVVGYTDSTGAENYNMMLSQRRAQAVADYIVGQSYNVTANDIEVVGMGESDPVASNDTREGRAQNRRVVVFAEGALTKAAE